MHRILYMCLDAAIASVLLAPFFAVLNRYSFKNAKKACCYWIFAIYLSGMFAVVGLPDVCYVRFDPHFNFRPFAYMFSDYQNSLLNVLLFVPLGFFLPVFWKCFSSLWKTALFGLSVSLLIETLQIFTYRATDVNDLMTNTLGTVIGWITGMLLLRSAPAISPQENCRDVGTVCAAAFLNMFFLHPFFSEFLWKMV